MKQNNRCHNNSKWLPEGKGQKGVKIFMFLLSPVLGLAYSLKSLGTRSTFVIMLLFCLCFGLAFTVSNVRTEGSIDGITYRAVFEEYQYKTSDIFQREFSDYITFESKEQDFYFNSLAYGISRFTSNYHIFFLFAAFIFAFFQLRTLRFFTSHNNFSNSLFFFILFCFFIWNQIFNINGVRFWTAAWIAVYTCFQLFINHNKRYILLALLVPFVHGSYFIFLIALVIYYFTGRLEKFWKIFFWASFIISTFVLEFLSVDFFTFLPEVFAKRAEFYTDSQYLEERSSGTGFWFVDKVFSTLSFIYVNILAAIVIFKNNRNASQDSDRSLLRFLIVWISLSNILMPIPSAGGRFIQLTYPMIAYLWMSYFSNKKYSRFIYALPFVWFMNIFHMIVLYISVLDWSFYILTPIYQLFDKIIF